MRYVLTAVLVGGCAAAGNEGAGDSGAGATDPSGEVCRGAVLEADLTIDADLPDPAGWTLPPDAILSTTYLQLGASAEAQQAFGESVGPIAATIEASPGLMGLSFANSASCGTARTLSAWASMEDMMGFVTGDAHAAAMARIGEISRGGSITMSWPVAEFDDTSWPTVIAALEAHAGPEY